MAPTCKSSVVICQRRLTHYRVPLFERLRTELEQVRVKLHLVHGQPAPGEEGKRDSGSLAWAEKVENRYWKVGGKYLCWQPLPADALSSDLVIITQENSLLSNYPLLARRRFGGPKVAFWGHGANLQSRKPTGVKERYKRWTSNQVDWWFAYTQMSADLVTAAGFPDNRITVLNNAVDTTELHRQRESVTPEETQALRESLGFGADPVGVFVGSLYADKRLDFLFAASVAIRRQVPDFHLLIVGEGAARDKVLAWCSANSWVRWVGGRFGREKVAYMSVAQVMLNPGLVGLGILDAFVCGVPMLTTDCGIHSPEISYLENGVNGTMTADDLDAYVEAGVRLLRDPQALDVLRVGCATSAQEYTVANMACRFADGIERTLSEVGYELERAVR